MKELTKKIIKKEVVYNVATHSYKEKNIKAKKFLAVFDEFKFSESTMDYAIQLTKESDAFLVGIFLDEFIYRSYNVSETATSYKDEQILKQVNTKDKENRDEAVKQFERGCSDAGIHYSYRRSEISRWFKTSMADILMKELDAPLFIAHNK